MQYKTGQLVWIDARKLGRFLCEDLGYYYVALESADFHIAHPFKKERVFEKQGSEFVVRTVPVCCENL